MKRLVLVGLAAAWVTVLGCVVIPVRGGSVTVVSDEEGMPSTTTTAAMVAANYAVAEYLLPRLDEAAARLQSRRRGLPSEASSEYPAEVVRLIEEGASEVIEVLDASTAAAKGVAADDLAPLHDYVRWAEEQALDELRRQAGSFRSPPTAVAAIDRRGRTELLRAQRGRPADEGAIDRFLAALRRVRNRAAASDLQTTLCVISEPARGRFHVFPASAPSRGRETIAAAVIANLWRGRYVLEVEIDGVPHEQQNLDLVSPDRLTLRCVRDSRGVGCVEQVGLLPACPAGPEP